MKKFILALAALVLFGSSVFAQQDSTKKYEFAKVYDNPQTPVKDQYRSGTCWAFSALGYLESELIKEGKGEFDLSEMWIVRNAYLDKAELYLRYHGTNNFSQGGGFHDIVDMIKKYGIVPEEAYTGLNYGTTKHDHTEIEKILTGFVSGLKDASKLSTAWKSAFNSILDSYFGVRPTEFTYKGKKYTPKSFAEYLFGKDCKDLDNYVEITSYTHHPFYSQFILEIPDNWLRSQVYNVKLDEMMEIMDNALKEGYSIGWGADVSEKGFSWKNGVAIVPDEDKTDLTGSERDRWEKLTASEKAKNAYKFDGSAIEKTITQDLRQQGFDDFTTTDDHGMVITGLFKDQHGIKFYKVKNSWNTENIYDGYFFASDAFVRYKTMDYMVNKNAIPKDIKSKLGIK